MSKYDSLWRYVREQKEKRFQLTFSQINEIAGVPIDHSFLTYKKELLAFGWRVGKISRKEQTVQFEKVQ